MTGDRWGERLSGSETLALPLKSAGALRRFLCAPGARRPASPDDEVAAWVELPTWVEGGWRRDGGSLRRFELDERSRRPVRKERVRPWLGVDVERERGFAEAEAEAVEGGGGARRELDAAGARARVRRVADVRVSLLETMAQWVEQHWVR